MIGLEGSRLRYPFSPNLPIDSVQSQSKFHQAFFVLRYKQIPIFLHGGCKTKDLLLYL